MFLVGIAQPQPVPQKPTAVPDNCARFHNSANRHDVNRAGVVSAIDALLVANWLRTKPTNLRNAKVESAFSGNVTVQGSPDVVRDCQVTTKDLNSVIRKLNEQSNEHPNQNPNPNPNPNPNLNPAPDNKVELTIRGAGQGQVQLSDGTKICENAQLGIVVKECTVRFLRNTQTTLRAVAYTGSVFNSWSTLRFNAYSPVFSFVPATVGPSIAATFTRVPSAPPTNPTATPTPTTPRSTPQPTPTSRPASTPRSANTPKPPQEPNPTPENGNYNLAFEGTGTITRTVPNGYAALQGCRIADGGCRAVVVLARRIDVEVRPFDEIGNPFSYVECKSRLGSMTSRSTAFHLFGPTNGVMICNVYYGDNGGHTIRIARDKFYGAAVTSNPAGKISCNKTEKNRRETVVGVGQAFELHWSRTIWLQPGATRDARHFCYYQCRSLDGSATVTGPKG